MKDVFGASPCGMVRARRGRVGWGFGGSSLSTWLEKGGDVEWGFRCKDIGKFLLGALLIPLGVEPPPSPPPPLGGSPPTGGPTTVVPIQLTIPRHGGAYDTHS